MFPLASPPFRRLACASVVSLGLTALPHAAFAIDIQKVTSPGGITAWLVEDHTVPIVSMDFAFKDAGAAQDPANKIGLSNLLSSLLDEGAGDLNSEQFQEKLETEAVKLGYDVGRDHFYGGLRTLEPNLATGFDLLGQTLTKARLDPEAIERMRTRILAGIRHSETDPQTVASHLWSAAAFPNHPYGRPTEGTATTVASITRDDLLNAYRTRFGKDNLEIAVVGAIDAKTLAPLLDKTFGALPAKAELAPVPDTTPVTGKEVRQVLPFPQAVIRFGGPGLMRHDPDFIPAYVMNHILGGGTFSSWLFQEVREKRGLAYSVSTFLVPYDHAAIFGGGTATRADKAEESLAVIKAQLTKMATEGPTQQELDDAKQFLVGSFPLRFGSSSSISRQLLSLQLEDLGIDYLDKRNQLIEAVTLDDVRRAAHRILSQGEPTVAVVGPTGA